MIHIKQGTGDSLKSFILATKYLENAVLTLQIMFLYVVIFLNWTL